jgi:hypothetical protein
VTDAQIKEAVDQMMVHCDLKMAEYEMVSARGVLYELGYFDEDAEQVLRWLFRAGFTYCLDAEHHKGSVERIEQSVCYWGPDQLKSRLRFVS